MKTLREYMNLESVVPIVTLIIAVLGTIGLLPMPFEKIALILLGFLAINALIDRTTFFRRIQQEVGKLGYRRGLRSRLDPDFQDFNTYCRAGQDVFLCGFSLGFVMAQQQFFFEEKLKSGCTLRLLIVDPNLPPDAFAMIVEHDERSENSGFPEMLRNEIKNSVSILKHLRNTPNRTGHLEVRAAKGLPVLTVTMVNPTQATGKMRIELRPYKRNQGYRPYIELTHQEPQDRYWYDFFLQQYYVKLWEESEVIVPD